MKIEFNNIIINNFMSFGHAELNLSQRGYALLNGVNNNPADNAKSNGSGKSSIFEALLWCLTGDTVRGVDKGLVNRNSTEGCSVELNCNIDKHSYKIIRCKDHPKMKSDLKIFIDGEDKSGKGLKDSKELLKNYLPDLTTSLLSSVVILGQGLPQRFTNNTPSGRKEILEKLSKSDFMIEDIKERINQRQNSLEINLRSYEDESLKLQTTLQLKKQLLSSNKNRYESLHIDDNIEQQLKEDKIKLQGLKINLDSYRAELAALTEKNTQYRRELEQLTSGVEGTRASLRRGLEEKLAYPTGRLNAFKVQIESIKNQIKQIESTKDVCPTCGQKLPHVVKMDTAHLKNQLEEFEQQRDELNKEIEKIHAQFAEQLNKTEVRAKCGKEELDTQFMEVHKGIENKSTLIDVTVRDIAQLEYHIQAIEDKLSNFNKEQTTLLEQIEQFTQEVIQLEQQILYNNEEIDNCKLQLEIIRKIFSIAIRDFRGFLLTNVLNFLDKKAKEYAKIVFKNDLIRFSLDGNNLNIFYDDKQYELLSGGERQRIDIIIQFALRDMLCHFSNFSSNIIVLDELFDNLDTTSTDAILDLITEVLSDVDSVFIITHHSELMLPIDTTILVSKNMHGISEIKDDIS